MTSLTFDDPCIIFALRRESFVFRREFRPQQHFRGAPCWARFCGASWLSVLVLHVGVGKAAMERTLSWLLNGPVVQNISYRPKVVISAGFSGALEESSKVGDVIVADGVADGEGGCWPTTWPGKLSPGECWPVLHRGRLLTVPTLVATPQEKLALGKRHGVTAVDMETSVLARRCSEGGVPFGCVRVISDDLHTPLSPQLLSVLSGSRVSCLRFVKLLAGHPGMAVEAKRLAAQTRLAATRLAKALGELLTLTLPWKKEL